jgi:Trk K+ transport system NAD-binding subunit
MITWSHKLYAICEPFLGIFERRVAFREEAGEGPGPIGGYDFIVFGLGRYGQRIGTLLHRQGYRVLGVDFDPEALAAWTRLGLGGRYGDATDPEFATHLPLQGVQAVVSAVSRDRGALTDVDPQIAMLQGLRDAGFGGQVVLSVNFEAEEAPLLARGASLVLNPFRDAADYAVEQLTAGAQSGRGASALS